MGRQKATTKAKPARAKQLRANGLKVDEIATAMGISRRPASSTDLQPPLLGGEDHGAPQAHSPPVRTIPAARFLPRWCPPWPHKRAALQRGGRITPAIGHCQNNRLKMS